MNQDHAYIHREWHRVASTRDIPALIALYADDAILESPLVPVILGEKSEGVLHGKAEIRGFLEAGGRSRPIDQDSLLFLPPMRARTRARVMMARPYAGVGVPPA